ncbi:hypothetical protein V8F20_008123 [Naviculisporaceae sp. PSN 640]
MGPTISASPRWPETPFTLIKNVFPSDSVSVEKNDRPDDKTIHVARLMALTHNTIFRALNAVYTQCVLISPDDTRSVTDLLTFTKFTLWFLEHHHRYEETVFFPMLEARGPYQGMMQPDVAQHKAFGNALQDLAEYVDQKLQDLTFSCCEASQGRFSQAMFDAQKLRKKIDALAGPLERHLHEEIPRLLEVGKLIGGDNMEICYKALHDEAERTTNPYEFGPLVLGSQDNSLKIDGLDIQFPVLPFSWAPYIVQLIVSWKHAGAWRFCPSTFHGEPRGTEWFALSAYLDGKRGGRLAVWSVFLAALLVPTALVLFFLRFRRGESFELTGKWFSGLLAFAEKGSN